MKTKIHPNLIHISVNLLSLHHLIKLIEFMGIIEFLILVMIGIIAGVLSGLLGIGGGIIMIPAMIYILGQSQLMAQGTSLAVMLPPIGIVAAMNYYKAGNVNIMYAVIIALFFIIGSYFSSKLVIKFDPKLLRRMFAILIIAVGAKMFFQK